jgi:hypothetical protein
MRTNYSNLLVTTEDVFPIEQSLAVPFREVIARHAPAQCKVAAPDLASLRAM